MLSRIAGWTFVVFLLGIAAAAAEETPAPPPGLAAAIAGPQRTPGNVRRDKYRHPLETLAFFGIRPDMRVIEILPGGGWYTEILAPFLRDRGRLVEATPPQSTPNPFMKKMADRYAEKLAADSAVYGRVEVEPFEPPEYMALGAPDTADMIVTFANMHDLIYANVHGEVTDAILQRFLRSAYQVLKPGGTLGVVAHRAKPGMSVGESHKLGRVPQAYLVREAEQAGFRLAASSEVGANAKDPRDIPVWFLPPTLKQGDKDRAEYEAIGEADNLTLKFVKPAE